MTKRKSWWLHKWHKVTIDGETARRCVRCGLVQYKTKYELWQKRCESWEDALPESTRCPKAIKPKDE